MHSIYAIVILIQIDLPRFSLTFMHQNQITLRQDSPAKTCAPVVLVHITYSKTDCTFKYLYTFVNSLRTGIKWQYFSLSKNHSI